LHLAAFSRDVNPGVLAHPAAYVWSSSWLQRLPVNGGEMRFGHQLAQRLDGPASIDQIVHYQPTFPVSDMCGWFDNDSLVPVPWVVIVRLVG